MTEPVIVPPLPDTTRLDRWLRVSFVGFIAAMTLLVLLALSERDWSRAVTDACLAASWLIIATGRRRWIENGRIQGRLEMSRSALQAAADGGDLQTWLRIEMARTAQELKLELP